MEPFDIDDVSFFPCTCGYQVKKSAAYNYWQKTADIKITFFGISPHRSEPLHRLGSNLAGCSGHTLRNFTPVGPYLGIAG